MPVKGTYLAVAGAGAVFLWSGLKGKSWSQVIRTLLAGKDPSGVQTTSAISPISGSGSGSSNTGGIAGNVPASGSLTAMLTDLGKRFSWDASEISCWIQLIGMESTSAKSTNPSSGAFGWAQALGHGTSGTAGCGRNEYGGFGLSAAQAQKANCGSAPEQLLWMANYVKATYGNPCAAVQFHKAHNYY